MDQLVCCYFMYDDDDDINWGHRNFLTFPTRSTAVFIKVATCTLHLGHVTHLKIAFWSCDTALRSCDWWHQSNKEQWIFLQENSILQRLSGSFEPLVVVVAEGLNWASFWFQFKVLGQFPQMKFSFRRYKKWRSQYELRWCEMTAC